MTETEPSVSTVSVIIPHLNQPEFLHKCLTSLREQVVESHILEVIVVDNGSKVLPIEICDAFDKVRLEQEVYAGPGPARNHGVHLSQGDVLAFIDADCLADPAWLSVIAERFSEDRELQVIGGDVRIAYRDGKRLDMLEAYESVYAYRQKMYIEKQGFSGTGNLAMRRSVYDTVGPFAGLEVAEDRDWGRRATQSGFRIHYVPDMIVFHPARKTFAELCLKWDRHISHDFEDRASGLRGKISWLLLLVAMALSPMGEVVRIARSSRVQTLHDRWLAMICVVKIRLYRAQKMFQLLFSQKPSAGGKAWNRND